MCEKVFCKDFVFLVYACWGARHHATAGADEWSNFTGREDEEGPMISSNGDAEPPAQLLQQQRLGKHRALFM